MFTTAGRARSPHEHNTRDTVSRLLTTVLCWEGEKRDCLSVYVAARRRAVNVATPECGVYCICRRWKGQRAGSLSPTTPTRQCVKAPYHPRGGDTDKLITLINWLTQLIRTAVCFTLSSFCINRNICLINQNAI